MKLTPYQRREVDRDRKVCVWIGLKKKLSVGQSYQRKNGKRGMRVIAKGNPIYLSHVVTSTPKSYPRGILWGYILNEEPETHSEMEIQNGSWVDTLTGKPIKHAGYAVANADGTVRYS